MLDFLRYLSFGRKQRPGMVQQTRRQDLPQARWMEHDPEAYAKEGYAANVVAFRCVDIIAKSVASVPLMSDDGKENNPLLQLVNNPNPTQSKSALLQTMVAYRLITGNSYLEKVTNGAGVPRELWPWSPFEMRVHAKTGDPIPRAFVWDNGQPGGLATWQVDPVTGQSDVLHWKTFNPLNRFYGMSPIQAAAFSVDQHNAAGEWNQRLLQNAGEPAGVLHSETELDPKQEQQLERKLREQHAGPQNARRIMVTSGGLTWQATGFSPKDMDWLQGRNANARDIAAAFGVPTQVIPLEGSQTFANYEQARLALWEDTVLPLLDDLLDDFNRWLGGDFPGSPGLKYDLDEIPALESKRRDRWNAVAIADWLTINEKREATGYRRVEEPEADEILIGGGKLPLGLGGAGAELDDDEQDNRGDV